MKSKIKHESYGQVYLCAGYNEVTYRWRGILHNVRGDEVWVGLPEPTPDEAFEVMKDPAKRLAITDLRPWTKHQSPTIPTKF